jgi:hypothetical protein
VEGMMKKLVLNTVDTSIRIVGPFGIKFLTPKESEIEMSDTDFQAIADQLVGLVKQGFVKIQDQSAEQKITAKREIQKGKKAINEIVVEEVDGLKELNEKGE